MNGSVLGESDKVWVILGVQQEKVQDCVAEIVCRVVKLAGKSIVLINLNYPSQ